MTRTSSIGSLMLVAMLAGCGKASAPDSAIAQASATAAGESKATDPRFATADAFWQELRRAVREDDREAVLALVHFPFTTRGVSDDDPTIPYDQSEFWGIYDRVLDEDPGYGKEETMREYLERQQDLPSLNLGDGSEAPVDEEEANYFYAGAFTFHKIDGRWYWVSAYEDE